MRVFFIVLSIVAAFFLTVEGLTTVAVKNAECAYCANMTCYAGGGCPLGCSCMSSDGITGVCVSID